MIRVILNLSNLYRYRLIYLHNVAIPLFPVLNKPVKYGFSGKVISSVSVAMVLILTTWTFKVQRTFNIKIMASDGISLGAWLIFPPKSRPQYSEIENPLAFAVSKTSIQDYIHHLRSKPIILYFHGNAGSRAAPPRVQLMDMYAARFDAVIFSMDYRGFGDSGGVPSEGGLLLDACAAWDFLISQGAKPSQILLVGHSLGTGVVAALGASLAKQS